MAILRGIDVSRWQGTINWNLVKESGISFAILKAGGSDEGCYTDPTFERNYAGAKAAGIPVGAYYYVGPLCTSKEAGIADAQRFLNIIKGKTFEYPIAFDMEESNVASLGKERVSQIAKAFCDRMENYGYYVSIYANKHWLENYFTDEIFNNYDIWLAQWGNKPTFQKTYGMWQKSAKGRVEGIQGYVDLNEAYKHYPSIMKYNGLNGFEKKESEKDSSAPKPATKPTPKDFSAGDKVTLKNAKLFVNSTASTEVKTIDGEFYIYDGKVLNGRLRITNSQSRVGKKPIDDNVTGYVKKEDLE